MNPTFPCPAPPLLPHQGVCCLIDTVLSASAEHVTAQLQVRDSAPFGDRDGTAPGYLAVEYMAQTIGLYSGLERAAQGLSPIPGLLIGTRKLVSAVPHFVAGDVLTVDAQLLLRDENNLCAFRCWIRNAAGETVAEGDVKAYRPDDMAQFMEAAA